MHSPGYPGSERRRVSDRTSAYFRKAGVTDFRTCVMHHSRGCYTVVPQPLYEKMWFWKASLLCVRCAPSHQRRRALRDARNLCIANELWCAAHTGLEWEKRPRGEKSGAKI